MTTAKESTRLPVAGEQVRQTTQGQAVACDNTHPGELYNAATETALLRGMLYAPARLVLELSRRMEAADLYADDARTIYTAAVDAARRLVAAGQPDAYLSPERVRTDLQRAGVLSSGNVAGLLLDATSAQYPAPVWSDVCGLADALIGLRARRALEVTAAVLRDVAGGSDTEIAAECNRLLPPLHNMLRRAGLEVQSWG